MPLEGLHWELYSRDWLYHEQCGPRIGDIALLTIQNEDLDKSVLSLEPRNSESNTYRDLLLSDHDLRARLEREGDQPPSCWLSL